MKKFALAAAVLLSVMAMGAEAATTGTTVSAGQKINFGNYWQSWNATAAGTTFKKATVEEKGLISNYNKDAVTWGVLKIDKDSSGKDYAVLLSDKALYADAFDSSSNVWSISQIEATLNNTTAHKGFLGDAFTAAEQGLITTVAHNIYKDNGTFLKEDNGIFLKSCPTGTVDTDNDTSSKIYLLDLEDLLDTSLFPDVNSRKAQATDFAQNVKVYDNGGKSNVFYGNVFWWLRSPKSSDDDYASGVNYDSNICYSHVNSGDRTVRPALDLNMADLIFTTAADIWDPTANNNKGAYVAAGKSAAGNGQSIKFAEITSGVDYPTTTFDIWMDDTKSATRVTGDVAVTKVGLDGGKISIDYNGAKGAGNGEYVSALFFSKDGYAYINDASKLSTGTLFGYGKGTASSGTSNITIGNEYKGGEYHVEVFNENGVLIGKRAEVKGVLGVDSEGRVNYTVGVGDLAFDMTVGVNNALTLTGSGSTNRAIHNNGTLNFTGDGDVVNVTGNITGAGTTKIQGNVAMRASSIANVVQVGEDATNKSNLTFDMLDRAQSSLTLSNKVDVKEGSSVGVKLDLDLSGSAISGDAITYSGTTGFTANLKRVNVLAVADDSWTDRTTRDYTMAGASGITFAGTVKNVIGEDTYAFVGGENGKITVTYTIGDATFESVITDGSINSYTMTDDVKVVADTGIIANPTTPGGAKRDLIIDGDGNKINGNGKVGVTVGNGQILNLINLTMNGFSGSAVTNSAGGTLNTEGDFHADKVSNNGTMNVDGVANIDNLAMGNGATVKVDGQLFSDTVTAIGSNNTMGAAHTYAFGEDNAVSGQGSVAVGFKNTVSGKNSGAFGDPNTVSGDGSYAFGNNNTVSGNNSFALGNGTTVSGNGSVALGVGSVATEDNVVSVGRPALTGDAKYADDTQTAINRKIVNVAAGEADTDAVNYGQLRTAWTNKQDALSDAQLAAANSGITSTKVSGYDSHVVNGDIHVTAAQKTAWTAKQDALSVAQLAAANSGITSTKVSEYDTHVANNDIHVTAEQKTAWTAKQDALTAGENVTITDGTISATDTTYSGDGTNITIEEGNKITLSQSLTGLASVSTGTLTTTGDVTVGGALGVTGNATVGGNVVATGDVSGANGTFTGTVSADKLTVTTSATIGGITLNSSGITGLPEAQQNALGSGINSTKVGSYDAHIADDDIHVTAAQKTAWTAKQDALSEAQLAAANSGITSAKVSGYDSHIANGDIHVTAAQKTAWTNKQDKLTAGTNVNIANDGTISATDTTYTAVDTNIAISDDNKITLSKTLTGLTSVETGTLTTTGNVTVGGTLGVTGALSGSTATFSGAVTAASLTVDNVELTGTKITGYDTHVANNDIHVTAEQKTAWTAKQEQVAVSGGNLVLADDKKTLSLNPELTGLTSAVFSDQVTAGTYYINENNSWTSIGIKASSIMVGSNTYVSSNGLNANSQKITNVANGTDDTDAVNFKQMTDAITTAGSASEDKFKDIMGYNETTKKFTADGIVVASDDRDDTKENHVVTGSTVYNAMYNAVGNAFTNATGSKGLKYDATNSKLVANVPLSVTDSTNNSNLSATGLNVNDKVKVGTKMDDPMTAAVETDFTGISLVKNEAFYGKWGFATAGGLGLSMHSKEGGSGYREASLTSYRLEFSKNDGTDTIKTRYSVDGIAFIDKNGTQVGPTITSTRIDARNTTIANVGTPIDNLDAANKDYVDTAVSGVSGNVTILAGRVTANETNISNLQGAMSAAQSDITTLQSSMTQAQADIALKANAADVYTKAEVTGLITSGTADAVVYDDGSEKTKITLQGATGTTITNLKAGVNDTDAVNVKQMNEAITERLGKDSTVDTTATNATAIGSDNTVKAGSVNSTAVGKGNEISGERSTAIGNGLIVHGKGSGAFGDPTVVIGDNDYSVGNNNYITANNTFVLGSAVGTAANPLTAQNSVVLGNGSFTTEDNTVSVGSETLQRKIVNVADGEAPTDAATVGQVAGVAGNLQNEINDLTGQVGRLGNRIGKVGAGAAALAALHPLDFDPENKLAFSAGVGNYRSEKAAAVGMFYRPTDRVMFSMGATVGNDNNMVNAGVTFALDRKIKLSNGLESPQLGKASRETLVNEVQLLAAENTKLSDKSKATEKEMKALKDKMTEQDKKIAKLLKMIEELKNK